MPAVVCPMESLRFLELLRSTGLDVLKEVYHHISSGNCHHPPLKDLVCHGAVDGTTPLLLAAHFNDLNWVKHLIEDWGVNVNAVATYYDELFCCEEEDGGSRIGGATALFVAAYNGHIEMMRYLVEKGATICAKTSCDLMDAGGSFDGLSPLYGAAFCPLRENTSLSFENFLDGPYLVCCPKREEKTLKQVAASVKFLLESRADPNSLPTNGSPIWMGWLIGFEALDTLISHGLNLDLRNRKGETILHYWADRSIRHAGDDLLAVVNLLMEKGANVMARDNCGFTPVFKAINSFDWNLVDFFLERADLELVEKIDAMEKAGAELLANWSDYPELLLRASGYLRRSLDLRQSQNDPVVKIPLSLKSGQELEWTTSAQLENVIQLPTEYKLQSFLAQLRICGSHSLGAICSSSNQSSLMHCILDLKQQNRLVDALDVLWATLETIQRSGMLTNQEGVCTMADICVTELMVLLSEHEWDVHPLTTADYKLLWEVILATDRFYSPDTDRRHMKALLPCVRHLANRPDILDIGGSRRFLRQLIDQDSRDHRGRNLLHLECHDEALDLLTIRLLLQSRANANAGDEDGNGPLHLLAFKSHQHEDPEVIAAAARLLLEKEENPAHLDRVNGNRKTAAQVWIEINEIEVGLNALPDWLREPVPRLMCLCSRVIKSHNVKYDELKLPIALHSFVELH